MPQDDRTKLDQPDLESPAETVDQTPGPTHHTSDVVLAASATGAAPSFPAPSPPKSPPPNNPVDPEATQKMPAPERAAPRDRAPMALLPGARVDDFEVVRMLGRGAFGHVYLARQLSLDRLVALKVSANRGSEGRTMARLEHQHIVQVFSETVDPDFNQRLLCMQLVPGIGLEKLIDSLHAKRAGSREQLDLGESLLQPRSELFAGYDWNGAELLAIIDRAASLPTELDPSALHDREALSHMDAVEATAWFGARLAEALDFAHHHGVLHRDIKPANILVNPYGRPMLADFNISSQPVGSETSGDEMFGGTFAYMAPEHLDAFNPSDATKPEEVTARSDLYSLGLVLQQLLDGRISFLMPERKGKERLVDRLRTLADARRAARPTCRAGLPGARMTLERTISRCMEPEPDDRFASGAELAEQLDGCRRLRQAERQLPRAPSMLLPVLRRPFLWMVALVILPQIAGSIVNIAYNSTQIVEQLSKAQQELFVKLVAGYNVIVYPIGVAMLVAAVLPVWRCWRALARAEQVPAGEVETARQKALRLPRWVAILTAIGWFPGGFLFPAMIQVFEPELDPHIAAHFVASFCLSGLIALAYSLCGVEFVVLRVLYPGMWRNARQFGDTARRELAPVATHLRWIQRLAIAIPLLGAMTVLMLGGESANDTFRWLLFGLNVLGFLGWIVASGVTRGLSQVVVSLTSTKA
jgi:serine/threonine protein kinase